MNGNGDTSMNIKQLWRKHEDEYNNFELVMNPMNERPHLCAFMLLDSLIPGKKDLIIAAEHGEIFLGISLDELEGIITEGDIVTLIRCGVRISEFDWLCMFV